MITCHHSVCLALSSDIHFTYPYLHCYGGTILRGSKYGSGCLNNFNFDQGKKVIKCHGNSLIRESTWYFGDYFASVKIHLTFWPPLRILYYFDRPLTIFWKNSTEMADKFSFDLRRIKKNSFFRMWCVTWTIGRNSTGNSPTTTVLAIFFELGNLTLTAGTVLPYLTPFLRPVNALESQNLKEVYWWKGRIIQGLVGKITFRDKDRWQSGIL